MASFDPHLLQRLFGAGMTNGHGWAGMSRRGVRVGWPERLRASQRAGHARAPMLDEDAPTEGVAGGGWSWSERVAPFGVHDVRVQHHTLAGVAHGASHRCRATGWGMVISGSAVLEMRRENHRPARYERLEAGDVWSVPSSVSAWFHCNENEKASVVALIGGREHDDTGFSEQTATGQTADVPCSMGESFRHRLMEQLPQSTSWGRLRVVEADAFSDPDALSAALVEIDPGCCTDLHWHLNTSVWQICLDGTGSLLRFPSDGRRPVSVMRAGTVAHVQRAEGHFIRNHGSDTLRLLEIFRSDHYHDLSLPQWLAAASPETIAAHLCIDVGMVAGLARVQDRRAN